jgi:hypothetical protein
VAPARPAVAAAFGCETDAMQKPHHHGRRVTFLSDTQSRLRRCLRRSRGRLRGPRSRDPGAGSGHQHRQCGVGREDDIDRRRIRVSGPRRPVPDRSHEPSRRSDLGEAALQPDDAVVPVRPLQWGVARSLPP